MTSASDVVTQVLHDAVVTAMGSDPVAGLRISLSDDPRVSVIRRFDQPGLAYVTVTFQIEQAQP